MLVTFLPAFVLSGFIFTIANMPQAIQMITYVVPARYFVSLLKGIYLKGVGLEVLAGQIALLVVYAVAVAVAGPRQFPTRNWSSDDVRAHRHMLIKEFIQVLRDPRMRVVIFVIPCVQVLVIGYAVSIDVKHVPTAVYDLDNSQESRDLTARFVRSGYFDVRGDDRRRPDRPRPARSRRRHGRAALQPRVCRRPPRRPARPRCKSSSTARTRTRPRIALSYAMKIATAYSQQVLVAADARSGTFGPRGKNRPRRTAHPGVVQREPGKPQLLRARRDGGRRGPEHAAADQHGRGAGEGDRHHGADHGHADHAGRVHPRQDRAVCADRLRRTCCW